MAAPLLPDFSSWSANELKKAESAARDFLTSNIGEIAKTFEKRISLLGHVTLRLKSSDIEFEERMLCLSMIEEISQGLGVSAKQFFDIGCHPSVANMTKLTD